MSQSHTAAKTGQRAFTPDTVCDNGDMASASPPFDSAHPLLADRQRLNRILDVMYAKIHRTLFSEDLPPGQRPRTERILPGTGDSADDILARAHADLLRYPADKLGGSWEALGVTIARNKAVSALRAAYAGLRETEHRESQYLVSTDAQIRDRDNGGTLGQVLASEVVGPEEEYIELERSLKLRDFARDVLDEPSLYVFLTIHFGRGRRADIGKELRLTGQRVSQIYREAYERLVTHPDNPFKSDQPHQGGTDDH